jgi:hypothetical protein
MAFIWKLHIMATRTKHMSTDITRLTTKLFHQKRWMLSATICNLTEQSNRRSENYVKKSINLHKLRW